MSSNDNIIEVEEVTADNFCASCGKSEVDDVKLKPCDGCDLVRYCSDACQEDHRPEHETSCKERAAELRDEILFRQPENSHLGDCPICCLPFPVDSDKYNGNLTLTDCCCKMICVGCAVATLKCRGDERHQMLESTCPFCRDNLDETTEERHKKTSKRGEANDPIALYLMGTNYYQDGRAQNEEFVEAHKYFSKAAELGFAEAHYDLSTLYRNGQGVEKDEKKELYHAEEAAIAGHPAARHNLGRREGRKGRKDRAMKHYIIAANLGFDESIKTLRQYYQEGLVNKEDFAAALRAHHAAVNATKSPQKDAAEKELEGFEKELEGICQMHSKKMML